LDRLNTLAFWSSIKFFFALCRRFVAKLLHCRANRKSAKNVSAGGVATPPASLLASQPIAQAKGASVASIGCDQFATT
jgi:hypothetical protein